MVNIKKKLIDGKEYYYLEHSFREKNNIKKKEFYLGSEIPKNIEKIKNDFIKELYKDKWNIILNKIKTGFSKEQKSMSESSRKKELETFAVKFTYNTQRIEGSKLTLRETANLLEDNITPREKPVRDIKEAEAHEKLFYEILNEKKDISLNLILEWHRKLFISTKQDIAGKIRTHGVAISGSKFVPPSPVEVYPMLVEFFKWYDKNKDKVAPVELSALVHLKFVTIHPFGDGNGRISRLMMNFILNKYNHPLLDVTYENRNSYYTALERAQTKNNEHIFIQWFTKKYIKENKRYLR